MADLTPAADSRLDPLGPRLPDVVDRVTNWASRGANGYILATVSVALGVVALRLGVEDRFHYLPLILSFAILAAFDYFSGLRAPAAIAIIKDIMIYITVFAAVIFIPLEVGGWSKVFSAVPPEKLLLADNFSPWIRRYFFGRFGGHIGGRFRGRSDFFQNALEYIANL